VPAQDVVPCVPLKTQVRRTTAAFASSLTTAHSSSEAHRESRVELHQKPHLTSSHTTCTQGFASTIPGDSSTYAFGAGEEAAYKRHYMAARFAHTKRKHGYV
jgi:hypothetical protein